MTDVGGAWRSVSLGLKQANDRQHVLVAGVSYSSLDRNDGWESSSTDVYVRVELLQRQPDRA